MPLLKGKPLTPHSYLKKFNDDQEVFYLELTNEIFEEYEDYCARVIACNCMIWTCAITGKKELTYQEALDSEAKALKNIKDFAPELRTPILFLASVTKATHFSELADTVFEFAKCRYFVGESVQACFEEDVWSYAQILNVVMPTADEVLAYCEKNNLKQPLDHRPYPAELYKYLVEEVLDDEVDVEDSGDDDIRVIKTATLSPDKIRRVKGLYSKDKNRAYLKQFTEATKSGFWKVKNIILDKYGISTVAFSDMFVGPPPVLEKQVMPSPVQKKGGQLKQQSIKNFVSKISPGKNSSLNKSKDNEKSQKKGISKEVAKKIQKQYAATIEKVATNQDAVREEQRLEKLELRKKSLEAKRKEKEKLDLFMKEWQRKREDLECEDLRELPHPCPVDSRIPNALFGEFIMVLEFFTCFKDVLTVKDVFPKGLTFELLERALVDIEVAGPFSDILQHLLGAVFIFQEDEDDEVRQTAQDILLNESKDLSARDAVKAATLAARWSKTYLNQPLDKVQMDAITVTDILRLHLLASGGRAGDVSAKWRFQERGGYVSTDDPGLEFRIREPQIVKHLFTNPVVTLSVGDKLKVLSCLMNQILTYASVRDVMDDRYEKVFIGKKDARTELFNSAKLEKEVRKNIKDAKAKGENIDAPKEKADQEAARRQADQQKRMAELREMAMGYQVLPLGQDRAYRRYWQFTALPGLFVEDDERWPGDCLPQPTPTSHTTPATEDDDTMSYIRKLFEASRNGTGSDKENEGETSQFTTPKKSPLGESNLMSVASPTSSESHKTSAAVGLQRPLVCQAHYDTCSIHNRSIDRTKWMFFYKEDDIEELIKHLNKRGYREGHLRDNLLLDKERIYKYLSNCPVQKINRFAPVIPGNMNVNKIIGTRRIKDYDDANLNYPPETPVDTILELYLRDVILDTEEKIFGGGLGSLKVADRKKWRQDIEYRTYESQDPHLTWPTKMQSAKPNKEEEDGPSRPATPCSDHSGEDMQDTLVADQTPAVRDLAMAVLQLARSVLPKYLQKPLNYEEKFPVKLTVMERWELSLMQSTSFSQVYLHHSSLDSSIQWKKSVLNARCKICRRGKDDINMLLCDGCDRGFHLYCLKPKLSKIPSGDWFCAACRPKEKAKPVKSSRRRFLEEEEEVVEIENGSSDEEPLSRSRNSRKRKALDETWEEPRSKRGR